MATSYNINTIQGDGLQLSLRVKDSNNNAINLSGYDVRGVVKYAYGYTGSEQVLVNLNPIIVSGNNGSYYSSGIVNINVESYTTASIPVGTFVYDIERFPYGVPTGNSIKLIRGKFIVSPEVTSI
jgi:hypothetical protein